MFKRKSQCVMCKLLASAAATGLALPAHAATFYVNANFANCGTSDGTAAKPFCSIQPAVTAAASGDTVQVAAGSYVIAEAIEIVDKALKILGADPTTTVLQGFSSVLYAHDFTAPIKIVEIANFTISGAGDYGVVLVGANLIGSVHNCILQNNRVGVSANNSAVARVTNSIIVSSNDGAHIDRGTLTIYSSILMNNTIAAAAFNPGVINSSYNRYFGNTTNQYGYNGGGVGSTNDSDDSDPKFVDADGGDFHLKTDSPCIDAGSPGATDKDPDGTRADQGVYGGPGSAGFRPGTAGLPVVTGLLATPHDVAIGGTFTLTGTGKAP